MQLDDLRRYGVLLGQLVQRVVEFQKVVWGCALSQIDAVQVDPSPGPAALVGRTGAGGIDKDAAHRLRSGGEEVAAAVPMLRLLAFHQPQICLVNQGGCLERLSWFFLRQLLGSKLPKLVVNQRQQLLSG